MRSRGPRSEIYLRADIANIVRAIDSANAELSTVVPLSEVAAYRAGFLAALRALALAFDVDYSPGSITSISEGQLSTGHYLAGRTFD